MDTALRDRHLLVVVTGGIAAYKMGFAVRGLVDRGATVTVSMTRAATTFVGPATFEALTGRRVLLDILGGGSGEVDHIALARSLDLALVAPATANFLAKMAAGLADDAPSTVLLATPAPVLVAPAMNDVMWAHPATQDNAARLKARGVGLVGPASGFLAEGYEGLGRMVEPDALIEAVEARLTTTPGR